MRVAPACQAMRDAPACQAMRVYVNISGRAVLLNPLCAAATLYSLYASYLPHFFCELRTDWSCRAPACPEVWWRLGHTPNPVHPHHCLQWVVQVDVRSEACTRVLSHEVKDTGAGQTMVRVLCSPQHTKATSTSIGKHTLTRFFQIYLYPRLCTLACTQGQQVICFCQVSGHVTPKTFASKHHQ